jgi:membrane-associated protease RseP (regulator of RpoE activity)
MTSDGKTTGCDPAKNPSPAAKAGLAAGDVITAVNGTAIRDFDDLTRALHGLPSQQPATIAYTDTKGVKHTTTVVPVHAATVTNPDGSTRAGSLIGLAQSAYLKHYNPISAVSYAGHQFWGGVTGTFKGLASIPASIPKLFNSTVDHTQRSADSPVGVVGMAQISGSIIGEAGFAGFFSLVAVINVFIGIFNLLPILPLDGGHVAILLYEEGRKRIYRLLRRPVPGRVDLNKLMPVAYAFLLAFVGLTLLLLAADITNPIRLPS